MKEQQPMESVEQDMYCSDIVDLHSASAKLAVHGVAGGALLGISGAMLYLDGRGKDLPIEAAYYNALLFGVASLRLLGTGANALIASSGKEYCRKANISSSELGYNAATLQYKGKKDFSLEGLEMQKGDSFLYVTLPEVTVKGAKSKTHENSIKSSFYNASLYDIQKKLEARGIYQHAICIEGYSAANLSHAKTENCSTAMPADLLADKDIVIPNNAADVLVMTPEEFRELAMIPAELFSKAIEGVGSAVINELVQLASISPKEDYDKITDLLDVHLSQMLQKEAELHFNGAHIKLSKEEPFYTPLKKRIERRLEIREFGGVDFIQLTSTDGAIELMPLERALQVENLSQNEMVEADSQFKKARSVYVLQELLLEFSLDELLNDPYRHPYEFIKKYQDANIELLIHTKNNSLLEEELMDKGKTKQHKWLRFPDNIRHPLATMGLAGASLGGLALLATAAQYLPEATGDSKLVGKSLFEKAGFNFAGKPGGSDDIRWRVEGYGGMSTNGYYVVATTNELLGDGWYQSYFGNDKVTLEIPTEIENGAYIKIESYQENSAAVSIPVKNDSRLGAIKIEDRQGNNLLNSVIYNIDGTYSAVLEHSALSEKFHIEAYLVPSVEKIPHAVIKIEPLDQRLLSSEALEYIQESQLKQGYSTLPQVIASDYIYNVMPEINNTLGRDGFRKGFSREKVANLILESNECNCNTCNTLMVLLSSVDDDAITLNLASGYLHGVANSATGNGSFLTAHSLHAFGIDDKGVVYDATGSKGVSRDNTTQKFLKDNSEDEKLESGWILKQSSFNTEFKEAPISKKDLLLGAGALIGLGVGTFAGRKGYKYLRRTITEENINKLGEKVLLSFYTDEELKKAHSFFTGLSWSRNGIALSTQQELDKEGAEILHHMQTTINESRVNDYLDNPSKYDKSLSGGETAKMRFLARYLIRRIY